MPRLWLEADTVIFTGAFGSGKTEVAISYALAAARAGENTCIIDFDIVTPYFRVGDYRDQLLEAGLRVVAAEGKLASFELPAISPEIGGALHDESLHVVIDVGGDPEGARLLGAYEDSIRARRCEFLMVVNPFRPATGSPEAVEQQARAIESACQMRISGLVANPNLGPGTQLEDVMAGLQQVRDTAEDTKLPIVALAVVRALADESALAGLPLLALERAVRLPWEVEDSQDSGQQRRT